MTEQGLPEIKRIGNQKTRSLSTAGQTRTPPGTRTQNPLIKSQLLYH